MRAGLAAECSNEPKESDFSREMPALSPCWWSLSISRPPFLLKERFFLNVLGEKISGSLYLWQSFRTTLPSYFSLALMVFYSWSVLSCDQTQRERAEMPEPPELLPGLSEGKSSSSIFHPIENHCNWKRQQGSSSWRDKQNSLGLASRNSHPAKTQAIGCQTTLEMVRYTSNSNIYHKAEYMTDPLQKLLILSFPPRSNPASGHCMLVSWLRRYRCASHG